MKQPHLSSDKISTLHGQLVRRMFAVPKLQRNFVWDPGRAAKLLDSIYREMPIGSLFLWEMDRRSANLVRQSAEVLPSFDGRNKKIWFVIDGQQRLSVIHRALVGGQVNNDAGREIDFGRLCFVVSPENRESQRVVYRKPQGSKFIALPDILAADWRRRMPTKSKSLVKKVEDCRRRLLRYKVPTVTVKSATLEEIGEVFIRVNSQGMRVSTADRAIALMGTLDVRSMAQELRQLVRDEAFALTSIDPILMGFNLVSEKQHLEGDPPKLEALARRWSSRISRSEKDKKEFRKRWHRYKTSFLRAVDHLRNRLFVHDEAYLPSANMLATLTVFFYHHSGYPSGFQSKEIRKWFWATGVAQRYTGRGYHRNIVYDAKFFAALGRGTKRRFSLGERVDPAELQMSEYGSRSARTRAFFCLLASRRPRLLETGEEIGIEGSALSHANRRHRHHIYPKAQMAKRFPARTYNSLVNVCYLVARDNTRIGSRLPASYLGDYRGENSRRFSQVMKSHLIPAPPDGAVWDRGIVGSFKAFRSARLRLICSAFEKEAGMKLFRRT
jgi:hypothetical protein